MFASQCHLYLRTKPKEVKPKEATESTVKVRKFFTVNDIAASPINIRYIKTKESLYSEESMTMACHSYNSCCSISQNSKEDLESYNPIIDDDFIITHISKDDITYLQKSESGGYESEIPENATGMFLHGPDIINGYEWEGENHLILGTVIRLHNEGYTFTWYKDGNPIIVGRNQCIVRIDQPGEYSVSVTDNGSNTIMYQGRVSVDFIIHCVEPVVDDVVINKLVTPCTF